MKCLHPAFVPILGLRFGQEQFFGLDPLKRFVALLVEVFCILWVVSHLKSINLGYVNTFNCKSIL